jgi:hypothetical protein
MLCLVVKVGHDGNDIEILGYLGHMLGAEITHETPDYIWISGLVDPHRIKGCLYDNNFIEFLCSVNIP